MEIMENTQENPTKPRMSDQIVGLHVRTKNNLVGIITIVITVNSVGIKHGSGLEMGCVCVTMGETCYVVVFLRFV